MALVMADRVAEACPGNPDGAHVWGVFDNGVACHHCSAVTSVRTASVDALVEQHPATMIPVTHLLQQQPSYRVEAMMTDEQLESEVIVDLLDLVLLGDGARLVDIERVAHQVIERVRGAR